MTERTTKVPPVYVLADMEGACGIVDMDDCVPGTSRWQRARVELTRDVAAACEGARAGGAREIVVHDTHAWGVNLCPSLLPDGVTFKQGHFVRPVPILGDLPEGALVLMLAVHGGAGRPGHLPHTFRTRFSGVRLDGRLVAETELYGALLATRNARIGLVTGDEGALEEARAVLPWIRTVAVPRPVPDATPSGPWDEVRARIRDEATACVRAEAEALPLPVPDALHLEAEFFRDAEARRHHLRPWRREGCRLATSGSFDEVFRRFLDMAYLGRWAPLKSWVIPLVRRWALWRYG